MEIMHSQPRISVVMLVHNSERYLREAIESILNQTFRDFEFIIIDDRSNDSSPEIIQEYTARDKRILSLRNNENLTIAQVRNKGADLEEGKYIAQMDSDDVSLLDRFEKQFLFMENHREVAISGGAIELIDQNSRRMGTKRYYLKDQDIRRHIFLHCPFCQSATILRKDIFHKAGGYDPKLSVSEDRDLYFRLGQLGRFANLQDVIVQYRVHPASLTNKQHLEMKKCGLLIKKKAVMEYGYQMDWRDKLLFLCQRIIPCKFRAFFFKAIEKLSRA